MKKIFLAFAALLLFGNYLFAQKDQVPDTLIWGSRRYAVTVHRYVPSVLQVYYQRTLQEPPFQSWSSENHRGHIATFEVVDNAICLNTVKALRYRTRGSNLWSATGIDTVVSPDYFDIAPLSGPKAPVVADWFSGILHLSLIITDKKDLKLDDARGSRLLHIVNGSIVDQQFITNASKNLSPSQKRLLALQRGFLNFYVRAASDRERVAFKGHDGLFEHAPNTLSLFMLRYGNDPLRWPRNWQSDLSTNGAPFAQWLFRGDSLFVTDIYTHWGDDPYVYDSAAVPLSSLDDSLKVANDGSCFAEWLSGDFIIHYGSWQTSSYGVPDYVISKTQKIRLKDGILLSSSFSPSSFEEDSLSLANDSFTLCDPDNLFSVDDKQLAQAVGEYPTPKKNPFFKEEKANLRSWFVNKPLTDQRAKERLFRVRIAFLVNCNGNAANFQIINKPKGELFEFSNMVLDIVRDMPQSWQPATDRKGNAVDCWQILEFTVSNGVLTNADYK